VTMSAMTEVRKMVRESPELGAYRVRAALEQIGIHLLQTTCGRLLALNRKLYGVSAPSGGAERSRKEMPYKAHFRHEIWSVDIRYIEEHNLGFPEPVYLISVLENYSRACLASKISATQTQWDYLEVLFAALSAFGAPSMIGSSGGGQFYSNQAMDVYSALGIRKERIEKRQAWQNYIESHFNTVRKMADAKFARAGSWDEMITIHRRWMHDYNHQRALGARKPRGWLPQSGCRPGEAERQGVPRIGSQPHSVCDPLRQAFGQARISALPGLEVLWRAGPASGEGDGVDL
jgi:putative transposase